MYCKILILYIIYLILKVWNGFYEYSYEDYSGDNVLQNTLKFKTLEEAENAKVKATKALMKEFPEDNPILLRIIKVTEEIEVIRKIIHKLEEL